MKGSACTPLNVTTVAPVKFVPLIVTGVPTGPLVGVKLVIVGALTTITLTAAVAVLPAASRAWAVNACEPSETGDVPVVGADPLVTASGVVTPLAVFIAVTSKGLAAAIPEYSWTSNLR